MKDKKWKLKKFGKTRILRRNIQDGIVNWFIDKEWLGGELEN